MEVDVKFQVPATLENFSQVVASEVNSVINSMNLAPVDVTGAVNVAIANLDLYQTIADKVAQAVASIDVQPSGLASLKLKLINGYTILSDDDDVMVTTLPSDTAVATVHLPPIGEVKRKHFLIRTGGVNVVPAPMNTIEGMYSVKFGVDTVASQVMIGSTASLVYKQVPAKYESACFMSDGIDTWYIM